MLDDNAPWRQGTRRYRKGIEKNFNERNILAVSASERASRRSTGQGRSIDYPNAPYGRQLMLAHLRFLGLSTDLPLNMSASHHVQSGAGRHQEGVEASLSW